MVNQIEVHPYLGQQQVVREHTARGLLTEAWSPLGNGLELKDPVLGELAAARQVGVAELIIAWHLARGLVVIPKTETPARMASNLTAQSLELTETEMSAINALDRGTRLGGDPAVGDTGAPVYSDRRSFSAAVGRGA